MDRNRGLNVLASPSFDFLYPLRIEQERTAQRHEGCPQVECLQCILRTPDVANGNERRRSNSWGVK